MEALIAFEFFTCLLMAGSGIGSHAIIVHYTSPGGKSSGMAAVRHLELDVNTAITDSNTESAVSNMGNDMVCASVGRTFHTGIGTQSISYDSPARRLFVQHDTENRHRATAFELDLCYPIESCYSDRKTTLVMSNVGTTDEGIVSAMASWDGSVYFVYTPGGRDTVYFGYRPSLQLRKVKAGYTFSQETYPDPINVDDFSALIAEIKADSDKRWLQGGNYLLVVPTGSNNNGLAMVTLARTALYEDPPIKTDLREFQYSLITALVTGGGNDQAKIVYQTPDTETWRGWYGHSLGEEGGVSYKDGQLCFSAVDSIYCGAWSPEGPLEAPTDITKILTKGQARDICTAPSISPDYVNVTTGIAIVETHKSDGRLSLLFGCYANWMSRGGMGLLVQESPDAVSTIIPVTHNGTSVLAGAMFVTEDSLCPTTAPTTRSVDIGDGHGESKASLMTSFISCVLLIALLISVL